MANWNYAYSIKDFITVLTLSCILFTLFIKATTIPFMMRRLGLGKLEKIEEFEYFEGEILVNFSVLRRLREHHTKGHMEKYEYDELVHKYTNRLNDAFESMKVLLEDEGHAKRFLHGAISLHSLNMERKYLKELFANHEINEKNFKYVLRKIEKQIERVESGKTQFQKTGKNDYDFFARFATKLYKDSANVIDIYIRNRARMIIIRQVIEELKSLQEINFGFKETAFDKVIRIYENFYNSAQKRKQDVLKDHKATLLGIELKLVDKSIFKLEGEIFKDMYDKGIISSKIYIKYMDELDKEIYSDVRSASVTL